LLRNPGLTELPNSVQVRLERERLRAETEYTMAGFRMHITVSSLCGIGYGAMAMKGLGHPPETAVLAAGVTAVGGMLPDLDSDSGTPIREMFGVCAAVVPLLLYNRLLHMGLTHEGVLASLVGLYVFVRYGLSAVLKRITVHRGMFHSIPAMLICGLIIYLEYQSPNRSTRLLLALGVMLGFLSHLILDEIYSVDFNGLRVSLKSSAGSAVKFFSPSYAGTIACYLMLGGLVFLAYVEHSGGDPANWNDVKKTVETAWHKAKSINH
jgi:membrane-bound metal-dependent hydrolase YbcI (DUF457 family)